MSHFVGETNLLPGRLFGRGEGDLHVRPHEIAIVGDDAGEASTQVQVVNRFRKGPQWRIEARLASNGGLIEIDCAPGQAAPAPGDTIRIRPETARAFPASIQGEHA